MAAQHEQVCAILAGFVIEENTVKKTVSVALAANLCLLGCVVLGTGTGLAQMTERPAVTRSTINGLTVFKSVWASKPGRVGCFTDVAVSDGTEKTVPKLSVAYTRTASGDRYVELKIRAIWGTSRPQPTLTIGSESVTSVADIDGSSSDHVSFVKPLSFFNRLRGAQGNATFSFDGKSYSWASPSFDSVLQALEQCAAI